MTYRQAIEDFIWQAAQPADKFSHQPRLYALACSLAQQQTYDDDVLHAAAWLHDLGVFIGHRPADPVALATWDNVKYAVEQVPVLLQKMGFPQHKIPQVVQVISEHLPSGEPRSIEGMLLRDADILEQLGAIGILRTVSKAGRDTRFIRHQDALRSLKKSLEELPAKLKLESARQAAQQKIVLMRDFLAAAEAEGQGLDI
ncbi:HD domain-containing protein [Undibacterium terreum]|uniref:Phosphohydrolase n=1 Tax=Undibacterium terreum TaxID=1224302 RepID=A0A916XL42_9BURK|nr:HD domain-containing protein [Undibacterium terreum]GGC82834.1 phosphohydrolase [Undibacterium terreum]